MSAPSNAPAPKPNSNCETGRLFRSLLDRRHARLNGRTPWSIAELRLTQTEITHLLDWLGGEAKDVLSETSRNWSTRLDPTSIYTNDVVCGLILHALYAEHVRRDGTEGGYWNSVARLPWPISIRSQWIGDNGQPTALHRKVLEQAAQTLRLRNAFGIEGTFQWFGTGFLQFGFTRKGFLARLPEWLASRHLVTNAISGLLDDKVLASDSFAELWRSLKAFRHGNLSESQLRERLRKSPWILEDWHDDLVKVSRSKLHLGTTGTDEAENDFEFHFLSTPILEFGADGTPCFATRLEGLSSLCLEAPKYNLSINGKIHAKLIRQPDGAYAAIGEEVIRLPWCTQLLTCHLEDSADGSIAAGQLLLCWQAAEGVQAFKEDGHRYADPHRIQNQRRTPIRLLFPESLQLQDAKLLSDWSSPDGKWRFSLIDPNLPATLRFGDQTFWSLSDALLKDPIPEGIAERIHVRCGSAELGAKTATLHLSLPPGLELRWARNGQFPMDAPPKGGKVELRIGARDFEEGLLIHFGLTYQGRAFRHRVRVHIPFSGVIWFLHGKHSAGPRKVVGSRELSVARLLVQPQEPAANDSNEYFLLEGHHLMRRIPGRPFVPGPSLGLGSPLWVHRGPFNDSDAPLEVAEAVVDGGLIHQVKIGANELTIFPAEGLTFREDLVWLAWIHGQENGQRVQRLNPSVVELETGKKVWVAENSVAHESVNAIAAFLDGRRVGSWWNLDRWTQVLNSIENADDAKLANQIIRIFHCPLLYKSSLRWMPRHLGRFTASTLIEWLRSPLELQLPDGLKLTEPEEASPEWKRAVGEFWESSRVPLDLRIVTEVLQTLYPESDPGNPAPTFLKAMLGLTSVSPLLASGFALIWLRQYAVANYGKKAATEMLHLLVKCLNPHEDQVADFCANVVRADRHFLDHQIKIFAESWPHLPAVQKYNVGLLFNHDLARRLATRALLVHQTHSTHVAN